MKLLILYRPNSEHQTTVEAFVRDLEHQHDVRGKVEMISVDTRAGASTAELYDITSYPALVAVSDTGSVINFWMGLPMPMMNEVAAAIAG